MPRRFLGEFGIARKDFSIIFILLFNAFTYLYLIPIIIDDLLAVLNVAYTPTLIIWSSYFAAIVGSSIVGSILSNTIRRPRFLSLWLILGVVVSLLPALLNNFSVMQVLAVSILLGVSSGLGMPTCLAYFADWTRVENRGRIGGIVLLITNLSAPLFAIFLGMFSLVMNSIILAVWRGAGLSVFFLKPEDKLILERKEKSSFKRILSDRSFVLYFIAWLMFCLVDRFETPIQRSFLGDSYNLILMLGPLIGGLAAFVGGLLSDRVGRKRMLLFSFASLGIAYAIIGITSAPVISWYLSASVNSISTGMIWVLFVLILWGDLSQSGSPEKYYAVGTIPFFLTNIMQLFSAEYVTLIPETSAFSLAAFFLFIAVLPLLYAPETLPKEKIELRQLTEYLEKAKELEKKHLRKTAKN